MHKIIDMFHHPITYSMGRKTVLQDIESTIEACITSESARGSRLTEDHFLLFVERGCFAISFGKKVHFIKKGEVVVVCKGLYIEYWNATAQPHENLQYKAFYLKDHLLKEFAILSKMESGTSDAFAPVSVGRANEFLLKYLGSLEIFFNGKRQMHSDLIRLKVLELLFNLYYVNKEIVAGLLSFTERKCHGYCHFCGEKFVRS
jgi:hypothetical protein